MTTIAACPIRMVLVTDSSISDGDQVWRGAKAEVIHGAIYGTAGTATECNRFLEWVRKRRKAKIILDDSFSALMLSPKGLFLIDNTLEPMRMEGFHAIGSGGKACRAAVLAGASIELAVEICCLIDAGSAMPIQIYQLEDIKL